MRGQNRRLEASRNLESILINIIISKTMFFSENQTKTVVYVNLGKAVRPEENIWLSITGKKENVRRAREMLQEKLDQFY